MSVTGAHSRPHCVPGHIAPTAPMIGMVQKHRNYKNNVVKKKMEEERFSAKTFIRECRNPFAEILGFPRMDFREWISVCYRCTRHKLILYYIVRDDMQSNNICHKVLLVKLMVDQRFFRSSFSLNLNVFNGPLWLKYLVRISVHGIVFGIFERMVS